MRAKAIGIVLTLALAAGAESWAQSDTLQDGEVSSCVSANVDAYDDRVSPANVVADALVVMCVPRPMRERIGGAALSPAEQHQKALRYMETWKQEAVVIVLHRRVERSRP